jgi:hypothetical protein
MHFVDGQRAGNAFNAAAQKKAQCLRITLLITLD